MLDFRRTVAGGNEGQFALPVVSGNSARMSEIREPDDCRTMVEVRAGVDDVDRQIVSLIARRFLFMDAAARIKGERQAIRDERRKAEVIARVEASAVEHGLDPELMARLYEELIESSIAYEFEEFDRLRSA
jgi:isochorismate pyruvate lyase